MTVTHRPDQVNNSSRRAPLLSGMHVLAVLATLFLVWSTVRLEPWVRPGDPVDARDLHVPWTAVNPIGVNTFLALEVEPWKREQTLQMASEAGAGWIKEHFAWRSIETVRDSYWDAEFQQDAWAKYDAIVETAERTGLRIIARVDLAPQWARPFGSDHTAPPNDHAEFAEFISDLVARYRGRVQFIQIWNEPNLAAEWGGTIDPVGYANLLRVASDAARATDPNVVILSAPMAMTTENSERAMDDLSYWRALYDAGAAPYFDIMSANAYGLDQRYDATPDRDALNIRRIELLREIAVEYGDSDKAIWLNEYGWNASPPSFDPALLTWSRVSETEQALWTPAGIEYLREQHDWFGVANTWYFRQVGDIPEERPDYFFRAVDVEFTPRPLYFGLQGLGTELREAGPGLYNDLDASIRPIGIWSIIRSSEAIAGEYTAGQTGSTMTVKLRGNALIAHLAPGQKSTRVIIQGNGHNRQEIEIASGQGLIELASWSQDQAPQVREVYVEVAGPAPLLLDGIEVREQRSSRTLVAGLAALGVILAGIFVVRRSVPA